MSRILYMPHCSSPGALPTEHTLSWASSIFSRWVKRYPYTQVYWCVPEGYLNQWEAFYKMFGEVRANFKFIEVATDMNQGVEQSKLSPEVVKLFDLVSGKYQWDIAFIEKPLTIIPFLAQTQVWTRTRPFLTVVANYHYSLDADRESRVLPAIEMNQTLNACEADFMQFASAHDSIDSHGLWMRKLRKYASSTMVREGEEKPFSIKPCCDIEECKRVHSEWDGLKADIFQIHYGCSVNSLFNFEPIYKTLRQMRKFDREFKLLITTPAMVSGRVKIEEAWTTIYKMCPRPEFYRRALRSHVFIMWPEAPAGINHGSTLEMARLGVLPLFCVKSIPYPWDESYPFTFKNETELVALLKYVKIHYEEDKVQGQILKNQRMLDVLYEGLFEEHIDYFENMRRSKLAANKPFCPMQDILQELPDRVSFKAVKGHIKTRSVKHDDFDNLAGARPYYIGTSYDLRLLMLKQGYEDVGTVNEVIFEKSKE